MEEALGVLRFEIQLLKKSGLLQRRLRNKKLTLQDVLQPEIAYCRLVETLNAMCLGVDFQTQDAAREILDRHFSFGKATRRYGLIQRLQTQSMEQIKQICGRSTFYADKAILREFGLFPPSAGPASLPALAMPPLETLLSAGAVSGDFTNAEEAA